MKKRIITFLITLILVLNLVPLTSLAAITPGKPKYGSASGFGSNFTLTGTLANDIVSVAKAQVGKSKSTLGYTDAWCDAFVIDCARVANVPTSVIPNTRGCKALYNAIINKGGYAVTTPKAGDIVLYYCSACNKYPHISIYAGNNVTYEGNISSPSSVKKFDGKTAYYMDSKKHTYKDKIKLLYVRPKYTTPLKHTLKFNANGGSGTMADDLAIDSANFSVPGNKFTNPGYKFKGWNALRSDGKWYCSGSGWKTEAEIKAGGLTKALYKDGWAGEFNTSWTTGTSGSISVTFYAQWERATYTVALWENYSGKNHMVDSDFKTINSTFYKSRDTSVYTLSTDSGRTAEYGSMKIVGTSAGKSGSDLLWRSTTMGNVANDGWVGDNRTMTLSFWAKSSVNGAVFNVRMGYQSTDSLQKATLTTDWKYYTFTFNKTEAVGSNFHPYFDRAGTFWISEMQFENGSQATNFVVEKEHYSQVTVTAGEKYSNLTVPKRDGYNFEGWYTSVTGGTKITSSTDVKFGNICFYAHWSLVDTHIHNYTSKVTKAPTNETGIRTYTCECGNGYEEAIPAIIDSCNSTTDCICNDFIDVSKDDWYHLYVEEITNNGLMKGTSVTSFEPNTAMTRSMVITVLWRLSGEEKGYENNFTDVVNGSWYTDAIAWGNANGIVKGVGGGLFKPEDKITREQLASILYRYSEYRGIDVSGKTSISSFTDSASASSWALQSLEWAVNEGLLVGSYGQLNPKGNASRAEVAVVLARVLGYMI